MTTGTQSTQDYLAAHHIFTIREFEGALPAGSSPAAAKHRLDHAVGRGWAERVMRGVYVSRFGLFATRNPDSLVLASKLGPDAVIFSCVRPRCAGALAQCPQAGHLLVDGAASPSHLQGLRVREAEALGGLGARTGAHSAHVSAELGRSVRPHHLSRAHAGGMPRRSPVGRRS